MNKERAKHMAEIFTAITEGHEIEELYLDSGWRPFDGMWMIENEDYQYRIKPKEPREFWVAPFFSSSECEDGGDDGMGQYREVSNPKGWINAIKVREVIE